jgi:VanZ family protein
MVHDTPVLRWLPLWLVIGWLLIAAVITVSLVPAPPDLELPQGDKMGHVLAYAILMFWFVQIYDRAGVRVGLALGFVALGISLEVLQGSSGYRTFDVHDIAANVAGVVLGWASGPPRTGNLFSRIEHLVLS